ncbi:MAG: LytTR family transcriptional regulator DNA-binding domain-containing protein [Candidatus Symbiothrix sp.]|jgi:DNA-binding LytR/AlgR family response regulator|nr:LytTR family transcriptional regulator DNA-binding domain-containing protein [Candidatus Symbiothrix sp.]
MGSQKVPGYLYNRQNIVYLILSTAFFALVFINLYKPFNFESRYHVSDFKFFVFSSLVILTGVLVVVISRIIMYQVGKKKAITIGSYALWIVLEIFFMALFYTIYTIYLNPAREYLDVFRESAINTALVLLLPYAIIHLYLIYRENKRRLELIEENVQPETITPQKAYSFYDEKNELRLSVNRNNLLYIESADNYVNIRYLNKGALTRFMLRNSMKAMEEQLAETNVLRCHRSYMVNFEQINVIRRQKDGIYVEFGLKDVPDIPISKKYSEKVIQFFTNIL